MKKLVIIFILLQLLLIGIFSFTPGVVSAQQTNCPDNRVCLTNPLGNVGINEPRHLVRKSFMAFGSVIAMVAIGFLVFAGFKMVLSTTEESRTNAKEALKTAIGGYIVSLLAFALIAGVANSIGFDPSRIDPNAESLQSPLTLDGPAGDGSEGVFAEFARRDFIAVMFFIMRNVLGLIGLATIIALIYYGFRYLTSLGNEENITVAKEGIKWSLTGFILALLGFTIISVIRRLFLQI